MRGTHDLFPPESGKWEVIINTAREVAHKYGHQSVATPIFEFTEVFRRTLGDETDIVTKEMYTFLDRGGEEITLRPEFTAGICRAIISGGLTQNMPLKVFAHGSVFRYERPQKGRMRQFHQLDIETFGIRDSIADAEIIAVGYDILKSLGLRDKVTLELNSLGCGECRQNFRQALVDYFHRYEAELSEDSKRRLRTNPLRILDSKVEGDKKICANAPRLPDFLSPESTRFFTQLQQYLTALSIPFSLNDKLVRGLDYYNDTVFEFTTTLLGSQNAVLAGGRYDKLMKHLGGQEIPAIGFAAGIERLAELSILEAAPLNTIHIIPLGQAEVVEALKIAAVLRAQGITAETSTPGNPAKAFKKANQANCRFVIIIGEEEVTAGRVSLKNMKSGEQKQLTIIEAIQQIN